MPDNPSPSFPSVLSHLLSPWLFLLHATTYLPPTLLSLLRTSPSSLLSPTTLRTTWFSTFWSAYGPTLYTSTHPTILTLLSGHVQNGHQVTTSIYEPLRGVVLEIGAGSGLYAKTLIDAGADKVYAVEPNPGQIASMRQRLGAIGIPEDKYEGVPVGIAELSEEGGTWHGKLEEGSIDCIVTILCLCSIPDVDKNCRHLFKLLKPGGRWFLYEHVQTHKESGYFIRWYQRLINIFWPVVIGGCDICRDTETVVRNAGRWSIVDISAQPEEPWCQVVPHIVGVLVK